MWLLVIFGVIILLTLWIIYAPNGSKRNTTIPGPNKTDPVEGNLPEITASGSLHEYLRQLHRKYGPISAFWLGPKFCVSIASPDLLKEQGHAFDRPKELFTVIEPLVSQYSVQFANGKDGQTRHSAYKRCFSHEALQKRYHALQKFASELCFKWANLPPGEHIPLTKEMFEISTTCILAVAFGTSFADSKEVMKFKGAYNVTWNDLETRLDEKPYDTERKEKFEKHKALMYTMLREAVEHADQTEVDRDMFVQVVREINQSKEVIDADMLTVCVGGFHTTAVLMTWCLYFLATNPDIQEKLCKEVTDLVGDEDIPFEAISRMTYLRQVLDESLRCSTIAPYAARVQDVDIMLGGHKVTAGTPVLQAVGVMLTDEKLWPNPHKFDPERFSDKNRKSIPSCGFEPFGFAGKRKCPGYQLTYLEASVIISDLVRRFKVNMVDGQVVETYYGLVTRPKEEVWITVTKRK